MSKLLTLLTLLTATLTPFLRAQSPQKPLAFEIISIHPSKPGANGGMHWQTQPDGYHVTGQSLRSTILIAWFPQGLAYWGSDRLKGGPSWLDDHYDIDARVSEADLTAWQKQGLSLDKKPMLCAMLRAMLADRFHLAAHLIPGPPLAGFSLEVGKHAPLFAEAKPDETFPPGMHLASDGVLVPYQPGDVPHLTFYGATMADFAANLSMSSGGHPVLDHTGIPGNYDFTLRWVDDPDSKLPAGVIDSEDPDPLSHWNVDALGLRLTPTKLPVDTLVIDHVERPSEN